MEVCAASLAKALEINSLDTHLQAIAGLIYAIKGDWDSGVALIQTSVENITVYPDWYHIPLAFNFYRLGDDHQALKEAEKIKTPTFWANTLRAALYRKLDLQKRAEQELEQLQAIYPDITDINPDYFDYLPDSTKALIDQLWSELTPEILLVDFG